MEARSSSKTSKELNGFTITEVLIAMAIVGILVLIALPRIMPLISKAKSTVRIYFMYISVSYIHV